MADCGTDRVDGSRGRFAEQVLELGKDLFDWVQVGRIFWQEEEFGPDRTDELANCFAPVAAKVIQDDDIAGSKDGQKNLQRPDDFQRARATRDLLFGASAFATASSTFSSQMNSSFSRALCGCHRSRAGCAPAA